MAGSKVRTKYYDFDSKEERTVPDSLKEGNAKHDSLVLHN